jgi:Family of unknown function (DUF6624)
MPTRLTLRTELLAMQAEDRRVRDELLNAGTLWNGYNPVMAAVHSRNAARLREIIAQYGWPTRMLVGVDGEDAAWLVLQHAIGDPDLQRRGVVLLEQAVAQSEAPAWQLAYLTDRIAFFEGRPQRYGTQFDYDEQGYLVVYAVEDPERVDQLRRSVGLAPLEDRLPPREHQSPLDSEKLRAYRASALAWAKEVGWQK